MKKMIKRIVFALIIVSLILVTGVVIKTGKFEKLEGYMYAFAAEITNSATDCNATSSNATSSDAQECATSSNATSSDAQECATSSNATSSDAQECATSSNATSSNTQTSIEPSIPVTTEPEEIQTDLIYNNSEIKQDTLNSISNSTQMQNMKEKEHAVTTSRNTEVKNKVSFLESHKMYIMIIGVSLLAIVIVAIILIVDKKAIAKRKAKSNNNEGKIE